MRGRHLLLIALAGGSFAGVLAQRHNNWCFGSHAGITFNGGVATALGGSAMNAFECNTSISDLNGQTLFYTDGTVVFDSNNMPMPNGTTLHGSTSSAQGALVVPVPGNGLRYYLFTVPSQGGETSVADHMTYSVIDMSLNNGNGDVFLLNIPLVDRPTEQLTATYHANGRDVWVLTRILDSDAWYAYPITCSGIGEPVVSHAGLPVQSSAPDDTQASLGSMDVSRTGEHIASVWNDYPGETSFLEIVNFDNATGQVSGGLFTYHPSPAGSNTGYGVAFSPDASKLYWSEFSFPNSRLWQYDATAADPFSTEQLIADETTMFGALELGPDDKLYMCRWDASQYIARVDQPNATGGACGFVLDGVAVAPGFGVLSLSNDWIRANEPLDLIAWTDTTVCSNPFTLALTAQFSSDPPEILWSNGASGITTEVAATGTYSVMAMWPCDTVYDTVHVVLTSMPDSRLFAGDSLLFCNGDDPVLHGPSGHAGYLWNTGSTDSTAWITAPGAYWLEVRDAMGCTQRDTLLVVPGDCVCDVFLPNVFTPNADGINDAFRGTTGCFLKSYDLRIFNRWGQEIWRAETADQRWSGADMPDGVYVWVLRYSILGNNDPPVQKRGFVALLR